MLSRSLASLLILLCAAASTLAAERVRVATLNLQNYLSMNRVVDGVWRRDYPKSESEKQLIRDLIASVRPDILVLQEIGPEPYLEELRRDLETEGVLFDYSLHLQAEDQARHIAVLSNIEPFSVVEHRDLEFKYFDERELVKRGMLELSFFEGSKDAFRFFAVHLKSRWSDVDADPDSALRRTREAEACRDRIIVRVDQEGNERYFVIGDFNDHPESATMRRFYRRGGRELGHLLPAADSRGHVWTHYFAKEASYSRVDGVIVSRDFLPLVEGESGFVVEWPLGQQGSDHRMVYFDIVVGAD